MRISHEAIYQAIYTEHSLHYLIVFLLQARPKRRRKGQGKTRRAPAIPNRVGIGHRPAGVEQRTEQGHWEGDTIVCKRQDGFIVTLVERTSGLLEARKTHARTAAQTADAVIDTLLDRPTSWVRTITFDYGSEFAEHERMAEKLGVQVYFAAPYASYQRATNENTNGLIRRHLPKGTSFKEVSEKQLEAIVDQLNHTPRERLGYRTPNEIFELQRKNCMLQ